MTITILDNTENAFEIASKAVSSLLYDMSGRSGFGDTWDSIDEDTQIAIQAAWTDLILAAIDKYTMSPEDLAMLQALYSRSPKSVREHLERVRDAGSGSFMDQFFVGYGHASIGDCGNTTAFIEGVTMLDAKAIQDWPLYSGQEASTRYMDFARAHFSNPARSAEGEAIQERWRTFYMSAREPLLVHLREQYPRQEGEDEKVYERAIAARSFDILRAFLPAGATTNLSWSTNLRQANDHLRWLAHHLDPATVTLTRELHEQFRERYPHSFGKTSLKLAREGGQLSDVETWINQVMESDYYLLTPDQYGPGAGPALNVYNLCVDYYKVDPQEYAWALSHRPRGAEVPWFMADAGTITSEFLLDFGSFRDLQRHRNGVIRMPMLTTEHGFHPWYLDNLPPPLRERAEILIAEQAEAIRGLKLDDVQAQHYIAMGFLVFCSVTQALPAYIYRLELRSSKTVHPTLRTVILREAQRFRAMFPDIRLYTDDDPDSWTLRRGTQTIEERP